MKDKEEIPDFLSKTGKGRMKKLNVGVNPLQAARGSQDPVPGESPGDILLTKTIGTLLTYVLIRSLVAAFLCRPEGWSQS